ncbi:MULTISPECIES: hypothetical protein [Microbacterium]|uniref:ABC transporter permease n=2 Tax=Microbacterium TaxID=33882 RepID=A0ABU1HZK2_9MICO|nr:MULTISPECIES: hypothetical protein [Microbacterium]MDF2917444.1 hypothetical protein [Microbacterium sp.]APF35430.1 hypothetical protein BO218_15450 [Microbacterium paludicola]MCZ4068072.1 hypothetical protein [Microbacterium sp. H37-C3]MDQ1215446.1 hypothetical protein [Microbacterium arborescens]MDR6167057.1 hypothetical protein [Microbacterium paludicola]
MTAAPLSPLDRIHLAAGRGRALVGSILGNIAILGIIALAALVVPIAAALVFGPALLARL